MTGPHYSVRPMPASATTILQVNDHSRDSAGMRYVYPVVSRRAGGVSIGINLNPNNACNWRCIYCQVPELKRGGPPPIDLALLGAEFQTLLKDVVEGDFLARRVPDETMRRIVDVAFSGNGEPTSAREFIDAVELIVAGLAARGLKGKIPVRLITNGSLMDRPAVQRGVKALGAASGEVWFKVDAVTVSVRQKINGTRSSIEAVERRLRLCAERCPTWLQSCFFLIDGQEPAVRDVNAYIAWVSRHRHLVSGVHLYGLARPSMQTEAPRLGRVSDAWLALLAARLQESGLKVLVSP